MDGDWSTPDLVGLIRLMYANSHVVSAPPAFATWPARLRDQIAHRRRDNSRNGSRSNIHAHYDLGNEFFRLFLDANLLYSCALYERADDSLEAAQVNKLRTICQKLDLRPGDHVLEIGSGWGGFAMYAATRYGCRVTTTTISREQHAYAARALRARRRGWRANRPPPRGLPRFARQLRQDRQHRDVRGGGSAPLRRLLRRLRSPAGRRTA